MKTTEDLHKKQEATIRDFLDVVFRRKFMILSIVLVTTSTVVYLNARQPVLYTSSSRILVKRGERADVFTSTVRYLSWQEEVSSQIEVILSDAVFDRAGRIFADSVAARNLSAGLKFNPGGVRADVVGESNVFRITYTGYDSVETRLGCVAETEAYKEYYRRRTAPPSVSGFFASELEGVGEELEDWRRQRNDFLNVHKFFGLEEESRFHMSKLSNLESQLSGARSDVSSQELQVASLRTLATLSGDELENQLAFSTTYSVLQAGLVSNIKYALQTLRIRREDLENKYTPKHPELVAVNNQIRDLQEALKREIINSYEVEKNRLEQLIARQQSIENEIKGTRKAIGALPDKEMELDKINSQIRLLEGKYDLLLKKKDEAEIAMASSPEWEVTELSPPSEAWPRKGRDYVRLALGPVLSLVIGLGLVFFLESLDHSVKNVAEVEEYLGTKVLATIREGLEQK